MVDVRFALYQHPDPFHHHHMVAQIFPLPLEGISGHHHAKRHPSLEEPWCSKPGSLQGRRAYTQEEVIAAHSHGHYIQL